MKRRSKGSEGRVVEDPKFEMFLIPELYVEFDRCHQA